MPSGELLLFSKTGPEVQRWSGFVKGDHRTTKLRIIERTCHQESLAPARRYCCSLMALFGAMVHGDLEAWGSWFDVTSAVVRSWAKHSPIIVKGQLGGVNQLFLFIKSYAAIWVLVRPSGIRHICLKALISSDAHAGPVRSSSSCTDFSGFDALSCWTLFLGATGGLPQSPPDSQKLEWHVRTYSLQYQ